MMLEQKKSPASAGTVCEAQDMSSDTNDSSTMATLTIINSINPKHLAKRYRLDDDGGLEKSSGGELITGNAEVVAVSSLTEFAALLVSLSPNQALTYGAPERDTVKIVTKSQWLKMGRPDGAVPRSKEAFSWPAGAGVMMADYDPGAVGEVLDRDTLLVNLREAVPALADYAALWWPSSSSHITRTDTGDDLTGLRGQRLYWHVADASDIPRAGKALETYLWAAGFGWIEVGAAGQLLKRTLIDSSVWQPNRLDFAAGAACTAPLEQRRGDPALFDGVAIMDTRAAIPDPSPATVAAAEKAILEAKQEAAPEANAMREVYVEDRAIEMAGAGADDDALELCRAVVARALDHSTLAGDFPLTVVLDGNAQHAVTVGHVLDNPERYHGCLTLDPIEPDYEGSKVVGKLYLMGSRPRLYSFAHGGRTFQLTRPPARVELVKGRTVDAVEQVLTLMRKAPDVFDFGGPLVTVSSGQVHPVDEHALKHWLGGTTQFWRLHRTPKGQMVDVLEDPPTAIAKQLLSLGQRRQLKRLEGVITAPTLRPDGSILNQPGFDELTGLLLEADSDDLYPVPSKPTADDVEQALERLMRPFADFPLVGAVDRGVLLAALLTAAVRPVLDTAPAFGFDAPVQGSGKTLLAKCIAVLSLGEVPTVWPHTHARDDEEIRKRIMTILMTGTRAVIWDNVIGVFDSAALAGCLTSSHYSDRILGRTGAANVPSKAMWLLTGNNLTLAGDLPRRVLKCRIDPEMDRPFARQFDLDPEAYCKRHRQQMIADALTIIRAWLLSGAAPAPGSMASFEGWDSMVRQPVAWISREFDEYADPMEAVDAAQAADPEQEQLDALLSSLADVFGSEPFASKDVRRVLDRCADASRPGIEPLPGDEQQALADTMEEFRAGRLLTARSIAKVLQFRADRVCNGRRLRKRQGRAKQTVWVVENI
ncbi:hypothetical protein LY622_21230 [Halomonas sp. M5N1S17]|uniref:hypothetical protein n=1 Tax=Halomonas alkalisoli TaxID=2907158 RepID=UPI001F330F33|nr:hypothetical protein [Halomonas alkalisoli]MCE9665957.1 hypothetical protein [Halomonas alkalisoli]